MITLVRFHLRDVARVKFLRRCSTIPGGIIGGTHGKRCEEGDDYGDQEAQGFHSGGSVCEDAVSPSAGVKSAAWMRS